MMENNTSLIEILKIPPVWISIIGTIAFFAWYAHGNSEKESVEDSVWEWKRGIVYCKEHGQNEKIRSVYAKKLKGDSWVVYVFSEKHKDECFEYFATTEHGRVRRLTLENSLVLPCEF